MKGLLTLVALVDLLLAKEGRRVRFVAAQEHVRGVGHTVAALCVVLGAAEE